MLVFAGGKHRAEVVAGVAGLLSGNVAIVVVQVAYQRRVKERRAIRRGFSATDQRDQGLTAEILKLGAQHLDWRPFKRANSAAEGVQNANLELAARLVRAVLVMRFPDICCQLFDLCHRTPPSFFLVHIENTYHNSSIGEDT